MRKTAYVDLFSRTVRIEDAPADALQEFLGGRGYGAALPALRGYGRAGFVLDEKRCLDCGICVQICPYDARKTPREIDAGR